MARDVKAAAAREKKLQEKLDTLNNSRKHTTEQLKQEQGKIAPHYF